MRRAPKWKADDEEKKSTGQETKYENNIDDSDEEEEDDMSHFGTSTNFDDDLESNAFKLDFEE